MYSDTPSQEGSADLCLLLTMHLFVDYEHACPTRKYLSNANKHRRLLDVRILASGERSLLTSNKTIKQQNNKTIKQ